MKDKAEFKNYPMPGSTYYHYKGGEYEVLTLAKHSETDEDMVVYRSIHFGSFHVRPLSMWFEPVKDCNGITVDRFTLI